MGKAKTFAQQIAELDSPTAKDFDPEEEVEVQSTDDSGSEESEDDLAGTEHYVKVGKSKLRKPEEVPLGPEYSGSRISREDLLNDDDDDEDAASDSDSDEERNKEVRFADPEDSDLELDVDEEGDIDSDAAFGESDEEKFKDFTFRGSGKPREASGRKKRPTASDFMSESEGDDDGARLNRDNSDEPETDEDVLDISKQHQEESDEDGSSDSQQDSEDNADDDEESESDEDTEGEDGEDDDEDEQRAELRKIMGEEQQSVVASITEAAKADAAKGNAVKEQRKAFDSLLSVRMVLQKALIATNSMSAVEEKETEDSANEPYEGAEEAAIKLWNTLDGLRNQLSKAGGAKTGQKRKRGIERSTSSSDIWERMQSSEVTMIDTRQTTLEKWSSKVRGTTSLPISRKLNPSAPQQSITSVLQDQLASSEHLVQKTRIPRACAPVQRDAKLTEDPNIYDDGNFYQMLLKELVDQRRVESLTAPAAGKALQWTAVKEVKTRKNVDTKASKGRKMRFTVHEKLQNFMAPEDRTSWRPEAIDLFFGNLLGQKMNLGEDDEEDTDMEDEVDPMEALVFGH
ncbi:rRNA-processing protein bfr2 [Cadophora gregata]|uniref:rRNA-processing protein bfr2 n=1 Tax=Cadophora gregata TaxID=51156 RepID=UPI0026DC869F|nr:rRNA-processing protein bfr2 [Cadophora gregata]KAK0109749.1 rRNA-processing protein bfr2 [Cadophora gregata]KAK0110621.1 rRNA-processing protein bfr2 [Cadophora gregata f. sp. sojae]